MVRYGTLADIGTDHGLLPAFLIKSGVIDRAVATDVNPGPLRAAAANQARLGVSQYIEMRLGDGLLTINPGEAECCVIAGMGGMTIIGILEQSQEIAKSFNQLLLSPERDAPALRQYLHANGFTIAGESMVYEKRQFYNIIDAVQGQEPPYGRLGYLFGQRLLDCGDIILKRFLEKEHTRTASLLKSIKGEPPDKLLSYFNACGEGLALFYE